MWMIKGGKNAGKLIWEAWELLLSTHVSLPNTDAPWNLSYTVVAVTVEPRTWCCFILCFQAQTVSSSTNGAGCHDSHPGACGIDWLMSLGNGPCRDCLGIQFYLLPPSSAIAHKNFSPYIVQAIFFFLELKQLVFMFLCKFVTFFNQEELLTLGSSFSQNFIKLYFEEKWVRSPLLIVSA